MKERIHLSKGRAMSEREFSSFKELKDIQHGSIMMKE